MLLYQLLFNCLFFIFLTNFFLLIVFIACIGTIFCIKTICDIKRLYIKWVLKPTSVNFLCFVNGKI